MNMISPILYTTIRSEMKHYTELCNEFDHTPSKQEFEDQIKFLLLYHTGIGITCEASLVDNIYRSFDLITEDNDYDPKKDVDSVTGVIANVGSRALTRNISGNTVKFLNLLILSLRSNHNL